MHRLDLCYSNWWKALFRSNSTKNYAPFNLYLMSSIVTLFAILISTQSFNFTWFIRLRLSHYRTNPWGWTLCLFNLCSCIKRLPSALLCNQYHLTLNIYSFTCKHIFHLSHFLESVIVFLNYNVNVSHQAYSINESELDQLQFLQSRTAQQRLQVISYHIYCRLYLTSIPWYLDIESPKQ